MTPEEQKELQSLSLAQILRLFSNEKLLEAARRLEAKDGTQEQVQAVLAGVEAESSSEEGSVGGDRNLKPHNARETAAYGREAERLEWTEALASKLNFHTPDGMSAGEALHLALLRECKHCGSPMAAIPSCSRCDE